MSLDERLLVAAFGDGVPAADAWREWSRDRDPGAPDAFELRLLPAVYRTLRDGGAPENEIPALVKQMARATFVRTRLMMRDAIETSAMLAARGVDSMLLKGAALVAAGMLDPAARPMSDFDLLVRPSHVLATVAQLESAGWIADPPIEPEMIPFRHAARFKRGEGACDLHWWALWESPDEAADARLWQAAERVTFDGAPLLVPRAEHLVLHVIVHGTRTIDPGAVRWIGDALAALRSRRDAFDWQLFTAEAEARRVAYPAGEALEYLREVYGAAVPAETIRALRAHRVTRRQRRFYAPRPTGRERTSAVYLAAVMHVAAEQRVGRLDWLRRNLQHDLGARSVPRLAIAVVRKALRAFGKVISPRSE